MSKMGEEYNKRLEKYAPDLYVACKLAYEWLKEEYPEAGPNEILSKAIAKVEGKNE